jgi:hypothetical protein
MEMQMLEILVSMLEMLNILSLAASLERMCKLNV